MASRYARLKPSASGSTNPASSAPLAAPMVLIAYSHDPLRPSSFGWRTTCWPRTGNVPPIRAAGGRSTSVASRTLNALKAAGRSLKAS